MRKLIVAAGAALIVGTAGGFFAGWEVRERRFAEEFPEAARIYAALQTKAAIDEIGRELYPHRPGEAALDAEAAAAAADEAERLAR